MPRPCTDPGSIVRAGLLACALLAAAGCKKSRFNPDLSGPPVITVTRDTIEIEHVSLGDYQKIKDQQSLRIPRLAQLLGQIRQSHPIAYPGEKFPGRAVVVAPADAPFDVVKKILHTCSGAGIDTCHLLATEQHGTGRRTIWWPTRHMLYTSRLEIPSSMDDIPRWLFHLGITEQGYLVTANGHTVDGGDIPRIDSISADGEYDTRRLKWTLQSFKEMFRDTHDLYVHVEPEVAFEELFRVHAVSKESGFDRLHLFGCVDLKFDAYAEARYPAAPDRKRHEDRTPTRLSLAPVLRDPAQPSGPGRNKTRHAARPAGTASACHLPLDLSRVSNLSSLRGALLSLDARHERKLRARLRTNGFAVVPGSLDDITDFYKKVCAAHLPVFITSDSLLHLVHIQFDNLLKETEENVLIVDLRLMSRALQQGALRLYEASEGRLRQAAGLLLGYVTVGRRLVDTGHGSPASVREMVQDISRKGIRGLGRWEPVLDELARKHVQSPGSLQAWKREPIRILYLARLSLQETPSSGGSTERPLPSSIAQKAAEEISFISEHAGLRQSPLFRYEMDYTQYIPRGHYDRSWRLRQYFKAMMWYGRATFLLGPQQGFGHRLVSDEDARTQTLAACLLAALMQERTEDGRTVAEIWNRLSGFRRFVAGPPDDLTPVDYRRVLRSVFGDELEPRALGEERNLELVRKKLAELPSPRIYGGLGEIYSSTKQQASTRLEMIKGLRLFGQTFVPDALVMERLVDPWVGPYDGQADNRSDPFTRGGVDRIFPRGLDVFAALGNARSRHWLSKLGDDRYRGYDDALGRLSEEIARLDEQAWSDNIYMRWLDALRVLGHGPDAGCPAFMRTAAWRDKQLSAALGSWTQLRHDTILFVKQAYGARGAMGSGKTMRAEGYVEPVPRLYERLLDLSRATRETFDRLGLLDDRLADNLKRQERIVERLLHISHRELAGERLSEKDYDFIRDFADALKESVAGIPPSGLETTIVSDVFTDQLTGRVLHEGTGKLDILLAVYPMPDGSLAAGVGPVLSHYEFKRPMDARMTDSQWERLLASPDRPAAPPWTRTYRLGAERDAGSSDFDTWKRFEKNLMSTVFIWLTEVKGQLSKEEVTARIERVRFVFNRCVRKRREKTRDNHGHLSISLHIESFGRIRRATATDSTTDDEAMKTCVLDFFSRDMLTFRNAGEGSGTRATMHLFW